MEFSDLSDKPSARRNHSKSFWKTAPVIITAIASLITAAAALLGVFYKPKLSDPTVPNQPVTSTSPAAPTVSSQNSAGTKKAQAPKDANSRPAPDPAIPNQTQERSASATTTTPDAISAPHTVVMSSGPSRISQRQTVEHTSLTEPSGTAVPAVMARSEFLPIEPVSQPHAVYPDAAKARRITGTVSILVTVGKDGKVNNPRFKTGPLVFRDAAFDAVRQWLYKPAMLNGQPIEQETEIRLNFKP